MNEKALLEIHDLSVSFSDAGPPAVRGISLNVMPGQRVGLIGESGSGKSVSAMSVLRLNDEKAVKYGLSSTIKFNGKELLRAPLKDIRRICGAEISMIFQDPMAVLNPVFRVGDQVRDVLVAHQQISRRKASEIAVASLDAVGIRNSNRVVRQYPHELSGGMRQRVMIAMAIASSPDLLIADEPTSALDVTVQVGVLDTLGNLADNRGMAVLMITHDMGVVARFCDYVNVMFQGEIVESGRVTDVLTSPKHAYTAKLLSAVPRLHQPAPKNASRS